MPQPGTAVNEPARSIVERMNFRLSSARSWSGCGEVMGGKLRQGAVFCQVLCGAKGYRLSAIGYWGVPHRFRSRRTSLRPDQVSSTAATLMSTNPVGRAISRTASSVISVATPDVFLGQEI